jgi:hypothetical protein
LLPRLAACDPRYAAALVGGKNPEKENMSKFKTRLGKVRLG